MFVWQRPGWPQFTWDDGQLLGPLAQARLAQGRLLGSMARLGSDLTSQAQLVALTAAGVDSAAIEAQTLDRASVRSSLARRLGIAEESVRRSDRLADGVAEILLDAARGYHAPLTAERLFRWHRWLFPVAAAGLRPDAVGAWRTDAEGPMQVISGLMGRLRIHFQAPPAGRVSRDMGRFLDWFGGDSKPEGLIRAGVAHLWFLTVHPFEDGNGRIARAIADLALAQSEQAPQRFYSMTSQILVERADYYDRLEHAQRGTLDITEWLVWFLGCFGRAIDRAQDEQREMFGRADFWQRNLGESFSDRQRQVLNRLLSGFDGKLTARKWARLGKCSMATAQRDIGDLLDRGLLVKNPGGSRSTSYRLVET